MVLVDLLVVHDLSAISMNSYCHHLLHQVPSSSPSAAGGGATALSAAQPLGLPDFLSDGPMGSLRPAADGPGRAPLHGGDAETNGGATEARQDTAGGVSTEDAEGENTGRPADWVGRPMVDGCEAEEGDEGTEPTAKPFMN